MYEQYFLNTLDNLGIKGIRKRFWLKMYRENQAHATQMFYNKLERDYEGERRWVIAKKLLLKKHPHFSISEPEPEPVFNLEYFLKLNDGRWGCAMEDIWEYERENGVIL